MSVDFSERPFVLQPSDADKSLTFSFPAASAATENDGAIPYGTIISSAAVTIAREDDGTDATSEIIQSTSNTDTTVTVAFTYPTTAGSGTYYLKFVLTLDTGSDYEFDYIVECIDKPLGNFIERIRQKVKDEPDSDSIQGRLIYPTDYVNAVNEALKIYSNIYPYIKTVEDTGDGGYDFDLPSDWDDNSSYIVNIEYPTGNQIPSYLYGDEYMIYDDVSAKKIRFVGTTPGDSEAFRITYTVDHTTSTIPLKHIDAVNYLAASICCKQIAGYYSHTSDSLIKSDSVKYDKKSKEFLSLSEEYYKMYKDQMGMKYRRNNITDTAPPAAIDVDWDFGLSKQHTWRRYLTHRVRR